MMIRRVFQIAVVTALLVPASVQARPVYHGQITVYGHNFPVQMYDPINGVRTLAATAYNPAISNDGRYAAFAEKTFTGACYQLRILDVQAFKRITLPGLNSSACDDYPALSTDGRLIAWDCSGSSGDPWNICLYDTQLKQRLPDSMFPNLNSTSSDEHPAFSGDGRYLVYDTGRFGISHGASDIVLYDLQAKALVTLPATFPTSGDERFPGISADGNVISYVDGPLLGGRVHVYDRTTETLVTAPAANDQEDPTLSSDGNQVIFVNQQKDLGPTRIVSWAWRTSSSLVLASPPHQDDLGYFSPSVSASDAVIVDRTPPGITNLSCKKAAKGITCSFFTNERITFAATAKQGTKTLKTVRGRKDRPGKASFMLKIGATGKIVVSLVATDVSGNAAKAQTRTVRR